MHVFVFLKSVPKLQDQGKSTITNHQQRHGFPSLSDDGGGSGGLVLPGRGEDADSLVVTGKTVDTGLDENEAELGVLVLAVALKVLADGDSLDFIIQLAFRFFVGRWAARMLPLGLARAYLLDQHVQVLGELGGKTY